MNDAHNRALLKERAVALAQAREHARREQPAYTIFRRGDTTYALAQRHVHEVARVVPETPLPKSPAPWLGITSLHGEMLALADLGLLVGNEAEPHHPDADALEDDARRLVLVMGRERREFGLVIDAVIGLGALTEELAHTFEASASSSRIMIGATADGTCVLDGDALLDDDRLFMAHSTHEA